MNNYGEAKSKNLSLLFLCVKIDKNLIFKIQFKQMKNYSNQ